MSSPSVLIVGAGPVGLVTALGLQHGGIPAGEILVVDQRPSRDLSHSQSKALSVSASTLEVFRVLGIAERFLGAGLPVQRAHFGGASRYLDLGYDVLGTRYPFNMLIPQVRTENILLQRCEEVGIAFAWGRQFVGLTQTKDGVSATFNLNGETETVSTPWLIGCDGTGSAVRQAVGIAYEGARATRHSWIAEGHVDEDAPTMTNVPSGGPEGGRALIFATGEGKTGRRLIGNFPAAASSNLAPGQRLAAPGLDELRDWAVHHFGQHWNFRDLAWMSVLGDGMRTAAKYRSGRVFVAGDAAHQLYPAGGQGMNTGLLDATNLAWKLALVVRGRLGPGRAVERVLDSYDEERRAAVAAVRHNVLVQMNILFAGTESERAAVDFMEEALAEPAINQRWARHVCGFADPVEPYQLAYGRLGKGDEMVGTRLTHISDENSDDILDAARHSTFVVGFMAGSNLAEEQRHVLEQAVRSSGRAEKVQILGKLLKPKDSRWEGIMAVLLRPDLRVAWVWREGSDAEAVRVTFTKVVEWWLGGT